ncbi:MAG TPA: FG-GAP-like repeat-containing protein [Candidatus Brocadiia bacterium]|nr:FG-GAP-like repeat-containing protein [Candidatus Brocadiia bacterium]
MVRRNESHKRSPVSVSRNVFRAEGLERRMLLQGGLFPGEQFAVGSEPTGVISGDYNGDGLADLVTVNNKSDNVSVLLGSGDGSYGLQVSYATGTRPYGVAGADFNGDGFADIATANVSGNNASVLLGAGDGTFGAPAFFATGASPAAIVSADFNGDGKSDLAVANWKDNNVSVLLGAGDGTFAGHATYPVGTSPYSVISADFNADGNADIATANSGSANLSVLLGAGNGTFGTQNAYAAGTVPTSVVAADFNGDGKTDLAAANRSSNNLSVLAGVGDGTFGTQTTRDTGAYPSFIISADLNNDGKADLATANAWSGDMSVLLGAGDGSFGAQKAIPVGGSPRSLVSADINGDGNADLVTSNLMSACVAVFLGSGDGIFGAPAYGTGNGPSNIVAADFNGDSLPDLAASISGDDNVSVLLNAGAGAFGSHVTYAAGDAPSGIISADFNGDGIPDLATSNAAGDSMSVLSGVGDGTFAAPATYTAGDNLSNLAAADFNGDGSADIVTSNFDSDNVSVLLNSGDGTFGAQTTWATGDGPSSVICADFNGDGLADLAVSNSANNNISVLLGAGDGTFAAQVTYDSGNQPSSIISADFNGDGIADLATANWSSNDVSVLRGIGDGTFAALVSYAAGTQPYGIICADFNGDGLPDIATTNYGDNTISVFSGLGDCSFGAQTEYSAGTFVRSLISADFNGDGMADIAVANMGDDNISMLLNRIAAPVNNPPVASDSAENVNEDASVAINLGATDEDGDALVYAIVANPAHGTLNLGSPDNDNAVTYIPAADFFGTDTFTFMANDGTADSNIATVTITVAPVNDAPTASDTTASTRADIAVGVILPAADIDNAPGDLTYALATPPAHGTVTITGNSATYTPNPAFFGDDSFTFRVSDPGALSDTGSVTVSVQSPIELLGVVNTIAGDVYVYDTDGAGIGIPINGDYDESDGSNYNPWSLANDLLIVGTPTGVVILARPMINTGSGYQKADFSGLGIVVDGKLGVFYDQRTGTGDVSFLAAKGGIGVAVVNSHLTGLQGGGMAVDGVMAVPEGAALYSPGADINAAIVYGTGNSVAGDVVAKSLRTFILSGGMSGDIALAGNLGVFVTGQNGPGEFSGNASALSFGTVLVRTAMSGTIQSNDYILVYYLDGNQTGAVDAGGRIPTVSIAGNAGGRISALEIGVLYAKGGITGRIESDGNMSTVFTNGTLGGGASVIAGGRMQTLIAGNGMNATVGASSIGTIGVLSGDMEGTINLGGDAMNVVVLNGDMKAVVNSGGMLSNVSVASGTFRGQIEAKRIGTFVARAIGMNGTARAQIVADDGMTNLYCLGAMDGLNLGIGVRSLPAAKVAELRYIYVGGAVTHSNWLAGVWNDPDGTDPFSDGGETATPYIPAGFTGTARLVDGYISGAIGTPGEPENQWAIATKNRGMWNNSDAEPHAPDYIIRDEVLP